MSDTITVENLRTGSALDPVLDRLAAAAGSGSSLEIDLSGLDRGNASHRRTDGMLVALLANLLLGAYSTVPLKVRWPAAGSMDSQLRRRALLFALAARTGSVEFIGDTPSDLASWRVDWRPRTDTLLPELAAEQVDDRTFVYVNTHRLGRGHFRGYPENAAMPWLGHLIPTPKDTSVKDRRDQFVTLAERAIVEVLENGPEHAFDLKGEVGREHWLRPPERDGRSFLLCSLTRGGKSSWDRLHILAMDNGYGISRTLRWQHPGLDSPVSDLLVNLLKRQLHQRGIPGHNGIGLWWLHDLACTFEGQMSIVTEDDLSDDGNAVGVTVGYRQGAAPTTTPTPLPTLPFRGTLVDATFVVPRTSGVMWHRPLAEREPSDSDVAVGANA